MPYRPKEPEPYRDGDWLRREYHGKRRSTRNIAEELDCSRETIRRWLGRHGIELRDHSEAAKIRWVQHPQTRVNGRPRGNHASLFTRKSGYETIGCGVCGQQVSHHRLLATFLVDDLSELSGMHVHHKEEVPWLNYTDGIEVVTPEEHKERHAA